MGEVGEDGRGDEVPAKPAASFPLTRRVSVSRYYRFQRSLSRSQASTLDWNARLND
jgi:hypothetical protein